ncbi:hypothetical protein Syun_006760 [Stephania yunnanensis]|uniref:Uncharacterized protein n=1 Tax=Stephania yunnanensis TaxID=152371 RepID=A0AAP0PZL7_9MAGN
MLGRIHGDKLQKIEYSYAQIHSTSKTTLARISRQIWWATCDKRVMVIDEDQVEHDMALMH